MNFLKKIDKAAGLAWKVLACILALLMFALVVIVFYQVICRFVLKTSTMWQSEMSTIIFIWATYLGAALAIRSGSQISMTLIVNKSKKPVKEIIMIICAIVCEIMYVIFTCAGVAAARKFAAATTPGLNLPVPVIYWSFIISGIIMVVFGIGEIIKPIVSLAGKSLQEEASVKKEGV